jgi:putative endonuclease
MKFTVYVLQDDLGKLYKGMTGNLERRLAEHRVGGTKSTSRMKNITIVYQECYDSSVEARKREKYLKSAAGRRFLKKTLGQ